MSGVNLKRNMIYDHVIHIGSSQSWFAVSHASCPSRGTFGAMVCGFLLGHVCDAAFNSISVLLCLKACCGP